MEDTRKLPIKIILQKSRCYNWEIGVNGSSVDEILATIRDADAKLKSEYGNKEA